MPEHQHQRRRAQSLEEPRDARPAGRAILRPAVSASTVPNMVPMAATPTEKNSAQPVSCGNVRAMRIQQESRGQPQKTEGIYGAPPDLVRQRAERRDQAQRHQLVREIERRQRAALQVGRQREIHGEQVGLHVAHEGKQPDRDERRI